MHDLVVLAQGQDDEEERGCCNGFKVTQQMHDLITAAQGRRVRADPLFKIRPGAGASSLHGDARAWYWFNCPLCSQGTVMLATGTLCLPTVLRTPLRATKVGGVLSHWTAICRSWCPLAGWLATAHCHVGNALAGLVNALAVGFVPGPGPLYSFGQRLPLLSTAIARCLAFKADRGFSRIL